MFHCGNWENGVYYGLLGVYLNKLCPKVGSEWPLRETIFFLWMDQGETELGVSVVPWPGSEGCLRQGCPGIHHICDLGHIAYDLILQHGEHCLGGVRCHQF